MNLESLRKHCATEVMGWRDEAPFDSYGEILNKNARLSQSVIKKADYTPDTNIEQAKLLADKIFPQWESYKTLYGYNFQGLTDEPKQELFTTGKLVESEALAITLTCAKATGWKDE